MKGWWIETGIYVACLGMLIVLDHFKRRALARKWEAQANAAYTKGERNGLQIGARMCFDALKKAGAVPETLEMDISILDQTPAAPNPKAEIKADEKFLRSLKIKP